MIRLLFISPFIIAFIVCIYLIRLSIDRANKPKVDLVAIDKNIDKPGFMTQETINRRKMQKFSLMVRDGISKIREDMNFIDEQRQRLADKITDQANTLDDQRRRTQALKDALANKNSLGVNVDIMRIQSIVDALEAQNQVLRDGGNRLVEYNKQVREGSGSINKQLLMVNLDEAANQDLTKDRLEVLRNQSLSLLEKQSMFAEQTSDYFNRAHDTTQGITEQLLEISNRLDSLPNYKESDLGKNTQELIDTQNKMMSKLRENKERVQHQQGLIKRQMENYRQRIADVMADTKVKIEDARQKSADLKQANKDRVADQIERIRQQRMDRQN